MSRQPSQWIQLFASRLATPLRSMFSHPLTDSPPIIALILQITVNWRNPKFSINAIAC